MRAAAILMSAAMLVNSAVIAETDETEDIEDIEDTEDSGGRRMPGYFECGDMLLHIRDDRPGELEVNAYWGRDDLLVVPEEYEGMPVTKVAQAAFSFIYTLHDIVLPDTITCFESSAFSNSSVVSINIPKSLRVIPDNAFYDCQYLENVDFHDDLIVISNTAFKKTKISIPENLRDTVQRDVTDDSCCFSDGDFMYGSAVRNAACGTTPAAALTS